MRILTSSMTTLAITPGCPEGIGPEVAIKALTSYNWGSTKIFFCGPGKLLRKTAESLGIQTENTESGIVLNRKIYVQTLSGWDPLPSSVEVQQRSLKIAIDLVRQKKVDALVTAPARKSAFVNFDGMHFAGHTELLHHYLGTQAKPLMYFSGAKFLVALATTHIPLNTVSQSLSQKLVKDKLLQLKEACERHYPKQRHQITVLGINPHAGESGLLGCEEKEIISPLISQLKVKNTIFIGPEPADGFFGSIYRKSSAELPHAVLAMYHDHGLAPYKLLCHGKIANITHGLCVPRTSPGHGTADDIAHKKIADPSSMIEAMKTAIHLAESFS